MIKSAIALSLSVSALPGAAKKHEFSGPARIAMTIDHALRQATAQRQQKSLDASYSLYLALPAIIVRYA